MQTECGVAGPGGFLIRVGGMARLTFRSAVRSRLVLTLALVLLAVVAGLPATLKGDGTPAGGARVILHYTLGLAALVLGVVTLWTACGAIAEEVERKHIQLLVSKPVRPAEIWLGKWLGILCMDALFLGAAGLAVYAQAARYAAALPPAARQGLRQEVLAARRAWRPAADPVEETVDAAYRSLAARRALPPNVPARETRAELRKQALARFTVVPPGTARVWDLPASRRVRVPAAGTPLTLRYRLVSTGPGRFAAAGVWRIGTAENPALAEEAARIMRAGTHDLTFPAGALARAAGEGRALRIEFRNGDAETSAAVVFDPEEPVRILAPGGSFGGNCARTVLVLLCVMALVAAVGLAASSALSFPVATFAAAAAIAAALMIRYFAAAAAEPEAGRVHRHGHAQATDGQSAWLRAGERVIPALDVLVAPATRFAPLGRFADGVLVSWGFLGGAAGVLGVGYPALLALLSIGVLRRREVALPA